MKDYVTQTRGIKEAFLEKTILKLRFEQQGGLSLRNRCCHCPTHIPLAFTISKLLDPNTSDLSESFLLLSREQDGSVGELSTF